MQKKILFISHETSRTGAVILLLNFLKWIKSNTDIPFVILLRDGGELTSEFEVLAPVLFFQKQVRGKIIGRVLRRLGLTKRFFLARLKKVLLNENIGLIYSNTIVNGDVLQFLSFLKCPVISHVHELEHCILMHGQANMEQIRCYTTHYIAVSDAVRKNLIENHHIPECRIEKIYEFVPLLNIKPQMTRELICAELDIPQGSYIICAAGTVHWRKGPDIFISLGKELNKRLPQKTYFLWIGGNTCDEKFYQLTYDIKKLGLEKFVRFLGSKINPFDYFSACDLFVMVSREDPFPIVCLEAAALGKPILCFDKTGGIGEFVEDDCGFIVPYLDVETMAAKISNLLNSEDLRQHLGQRAREKVYERHDIKTEAPKLLAVVKRFLSK